MKESQNIIFISMWNLTLFIQLLFCVDNAGDTESNTSETNDIKINRGEIKYIYIKTHAHFRRKRRQLALTNPIGIQHRSLCKCDEITR